MMERNNFQRKILVIKHGALGDFILATGPMTAIRHHHNNDHIVLLTTSMLKDFADESKFFDEIWIDNRPKIFNIINWLKLIIKFRSSKFDWVYDLQTSNRSSLYYYFFSKQKPNWSGTVLRASHPHNNIDRVNMHTIDRHREQLEIAGLSNIPNPNLSWVSTNIEKFNIIEPYGVLVPGGSSHRSSKRWPSEYYVELSRWLQTFGIQPVIVGTEEDKKLAEPLISTGAMNLTGKTSLLELVEIFRGCSIAIGNDTGPMHIAGAVGCIGAVLFSGDSDPLLCAPKGSLITLQRMSLSDLSADEVKGALRENFGSFDLTT